MPATATIQDVGRNAFTVGTWRIEPALGRIRYAGETRLLRRQVMELLVYLAMRPDEAVSTDQLLEDLWDGRVVTEGSVYNCVGELRAALAIDGDDSPVIETIPRKGYRLLLPVHPLEEDSARPRRPWSIIAATAVAAVAIAGLWLFEPASPPGKINAVVVLPLDNHSADPGSDEYFSAGMTEALIARLSKLDDLRVISRTSAMQLKNSNLTIPQIAESLDVDGVIEGSLMTVGDEIRLTLQLIDGRTDSHLWAGSYIREVDNVLGLQDEIANEIAAELNVLFGNDRVAVDPVKPPTNNADAYRAYLRGRYYFNSHAIESFTRAIQQYDKAIELDPSFALAWAARSEACNQPMIVMGGVMTIADCERDARRAVQLDPGLAEAHAALGYIQIIQWQHEESLLNLERAIEINPNSVMARQWYTLALLASSRFEEALAQIREAERLDPLNLFVRTMVGWPLQSLGRYSEALAQWDAVLELDPDFMLAHYNRGVLFIDLEQPVNVLASADAIARIQGEQAFEVKALRASAFAISGKHDEARSLLAEIERESGKYMAAWIASIHILLGDEERALARLERGLEERSPDMFSIGDARFDKLRDHPRFQAVSEALRRGPHL